MYMFRINFLSRCQTSDLSHARSQSLQLYKNIEMKQKLLVEIQLMKNEYYSHAGVKLGYKNDVCSYAENSMPLIMVI